MHFKMIVVFVEDDKTDVVMDAAREAGATGATVINNARGEGLNKSKTFLGLSLETQRDVVVFLVDACKWTADDDLVLQKLEKLDCPVILAVNKIDLLANRDVLLPRLQELSGKRSFEQVIPISAAKGDNVTALEAAIETLLPQAPAMFPEDQVTDRSVRFLAAELVREKLVRKLGRELPYGLTVEIESFRSDPGISHIHALIWVERNSQKTIVIGKQGRMLKEVGMEARKDIEALIDGKVNLKLWVKVKEGWADDERALRSLGYNHDE